MSKIEKVGAVVEVIAAKIAGVALSDRTAVPAQQKIDGGPSALYDVVAIIASQEGAALLAKRCAFQGLCRRRVRALQVHRLQPGGRTSDRQIRYRRRSRRGLLRARQGRVGDFVDALGELRFWNRELNVDLDAAGD